MSKRDSSGLVRREKRQDTDDYKERRDRREKREHRQRDGDQTRDRPDKKVQDDQDDKEKVVDKQKPNFGLTGKLAEDTNVFNGVVIKYNQPPEARVPKRKWRLYPFKGEESLPFVPIHRQSGYLLGRDRKVADIPIDHPSCSKQHCVIQFRLVEYTKEDGTLSKRVRPYIIDLESANGTFVNNQQIEVSRFYELFEKDVIKFGFSTREYVLLHEESKDDEEDDDVQAEEGDEKRCK